MIVYIYIYDDKEGKTNAISIDKKTWWMKIWNFLMTTVSEKFGTPAKKNGIFRLLMSYRY